MLPTLKNVCLCCSCSLCYNLLHWFVTRVDTEVRFCLASFWDHFRDSSTILWLMMFWILSFVVDHNWSQTLGGTPLLLFLIRFICFDPFSFVFRVVLRRDIFKGSLTHFGPLSCSLVMFLNFVLRHCLWCLLISFLWSLYFQCLVSKGSGGDVPHLQWLMASLFASFFLFLIFLRMATKL